jgi:rfaE bifunctional protein nucleotidyltransferase chain/domain
MGSIVSLSYLARLRRKLAQKRKTVVFTNGTFDILHRGHVEYLAAAKALGDILIVGLNTDASIRRIKGRGRPINSNADRATVLAALRDVDYVCLFGEDTPAKMIAHLVPDVLVKGADWRPTEIVGRDVVERHGGVVKTIRLTPGRSTSGVIHRILQASSAAHRRHVRRRRP